MAVWLVLLLTLSIALAVHDHEQAAQLGEDVIMNMHDWILESTKHKHVECDRPVQEGDWIGAHFSISITADSPVGEPGMELVNSWHMRQKFPIDYKVELMESEMAGTLAKDDPNANKRVMHLVAHQFIGLCPGETQETIIMIQELDNEDSTDERDPRAMNGARLVLAQELYAIREDGYEPPNINMFDRLDLNADTVITFEEFLLTTLKSNPTLLHREQIPNLRYQWSSMFLIHSSNGRWVTFDDVLDKGFNLTEEDRPTAERFFHEMDADGDGKFTAAEQMEWYRRTRDVDTPEGYFEGDDHNGDGFVTWEEFLVPQEQKHHNYNELINELKGNHHEL